MSGNVKKKLYRKSIKENEPGGTTSNSFWVVPIVFRRQNLSPTILLLNPSFRKKNHLSEMRQTRFTNLGTKVLL